MNWSEREDGGGPGGYVPKKNQAYSATFYKEIYSATFYREIYPATFYREIYPATFYSEIYPAHSTGKYILLHSTGKYILLHSTSKSILHIFYIEILFCYILQEIYPAYILHRNFVLLHSTGNLSCYISHGKRTLCRVYQ